jgi:TRAP-type C4-dicarboxylate transport system permease small subunit
MSTGIPTHHPILPDPGGVMPESTTRLKGTARAIDLLIEVPAVIITFVMMLHISLNAILRTWFSAPIDRTLEMVTYWYLPLVAFLGFVAAAIRGEHIAADLIYEKLPRVTRRFVLGLLLTLSAVVCAGFAWFGYAEATHAREIGRTAGASGLVSWPTYYLVPLAFGLMTAQFLYDAGHAMRHPEDDHFVVNAEEAAVLEDLSVHEGKL